MLSVLASYFVTSLVSFGRFKVSLVDQTIMFVAGSIRGAIAFGLVLTMHVDQNKKEVLQTTILLLVFSTTIVLGGVIPFVIKKLKPPVKKPLSDYVVENYRLPSNLYYYEEMLNKEEALERKSSSCCFNVWMTIDNTFMRKHLIYDWEKAKKEHIDLAERLGAVLENYKNEQKLMKSTDFERIEDSFDKKEKLSDSFDKNSSDGN